MAYSMDDVEKFKKEHLESTKLKQEIELLKNQNKDFKYVKWRANIAIFLSIIAIVIELVRLLRRV